MTGEDEAAKMPAEDETPQDHGAFAAHLGRVRAEIDGRLTSRWDAKLEEIARHGPQVVAMAAAARDLTLRGGKRFRAALVAAAYAGVAPGAPIDVAFEAGVSLELLQTYLLIQDDWIDDDDRRRGGPSVHAALVERLGERVGHASAVLASDLTWGFALATLAAVAAPAERVVAAVRFLAEMHQDVVIGQQLDVLGSADEVEAMHDLKTGSYTVRGPLVLGAILAGAPEATIHRLARYAAPLGVAFQLRDDLLGAFGTEAETGKPAGGDLREGKRSAVLVQAEARLDAAGKAALARVLGEPDVGAEALADALAAIEACGARQAVTTRLGELCDAAAREAQDLPVTAATRAIFAGAAAALRVREGA